ncbi:MAG: hypothetical protein QXO21_06520 [Candidatus Anstonellales archaeon]
MLYSGDVYTGAFLNISPSPYPASVSQAFTSQVNVDAVLYNPAGVGLLTYSAVSLAHHSYIEDMSQEYINGVINTKYGNISAFYTVLESGDIIAYDESENIIGKTSTSHYLYGISYSKGFPYFEYAKGKIDPMLIPPPWSKIKPVKVYIPKVYRLSLGFTAKRLVEKLDLTKRSIELFDAGFLVVLPGFFHIGGSVQNISKKSRFYEQYEKIPTTFRFGISKSFATIKDIMSFVFMSDYVVVEGVEKYLNNGMDINISKTFQIRVGYTTKKNNSFSNFVFGAGMTFDKFLSKESLVKGFKMDYAYMQHRFFGTTHRLGFQMIW